MHELEINYHIYRQTNLNLLHAHKKALLVSLGALLSRLVVANCNMASSNMIANIHVRQEQYVHKSTRNNKLVGQKKDRKHVSDHTLRHKFDILCVYWILEAWLVLKVAHK